MSDVEYVHVVLEPILHSQHWTEHYREGAELLKICLVTDEQRSCDNEDWFLTVNVVHDVLLRGVL